MASSEPLRACDGYSAVITAAAHERVPARSGELLVFLLLALTSFSFSVGGKLYLTEILALLLLPGLARSSLAERLRDPFATRFLQLAALWFAGQVTTDLVRHTPTHLLFKGWSLILFTTMNFTVLWMLVRTRRHVLLGLAGAALGLFVQYVIDPSVLVTADPWKFGYGFALTLALVTLVVALRLGRTACGATLVFLAAINTFQGSRGLGGVCLAAAGMLVFHHKSVQHSDVTLARAGVMLVSIVAAGFLLLHTYSFAASEGWLGENAATKYRGQAGALGPLLGGRNEVVFSAIAIRQAPLIGHGSWAQRSYNIDSPAISFLRRSGYSYYPRVAFGADANVIPTHSHLFGAWVTAGLLGLPFWLWALILALRGVMSRFSSPAAAALAMFIGCNLLWDILFSPFGASRRIIFPLLLISLMVLKRESTSLTVNHA